MSHNRALKMGFALALLAAAFMTASVAFAANANPRRADQSIAPAGLSANVTVFATGLTNPRGLKFGPDGALYVAEGGPAVNTLSTVGLCLQVPSPVGPYLGGFNSRISKISSGGLRTTVADGLPSSQTSALSGSLASGVADVAFIGDTLYGIEAAAGCSHGLAGTDNTVFRVNADGTTTTIADLSAFQKANPVANPEPDDFEPDGTWYSMNSLGSTLYAIEPNHGELDRILVNGKIMRVIDISAFKGHIVPTAFSFHQGRFFVGNLDTFPVVPGSSQIMQISIGGKIKSTTPGLTTVLGVAFDSSGRLYALESDTVPGFPGPGPAAVSGMVVRVNGDGTLTTIASGLTFPTAMTFGPDGKLYVSNFGFGVPVPGAGQIVSITLP